MIFCADPTLDAVCRELAGPLTDALGDSANQEISIDFDRGTQRCRIYLKRVDGPHDPQVALDGDAIVALARILATVSGHSLNPRAPILDCALANGARFHAVLPPSSDGPSGSIRLHTATERPLAAFMDTSEAAFITQAVLAQKTILVTGAMFSGKTSLLSTLTSLIPAQERLVVIEDTPELVIRPGDVTRRIATPEADLEHLVIGALRECPDWIVVGETRGREARHMVEAASVGHPMLTTLHGDSCDGAIARLTRLAACDRQLISEAFDLVIHLAKAQDGRRAVSEIKELK
jgi:type IV secretory pathway ATPase VirB11/archaellum biosynthesis ATPase